MILQGTESLSHLRKLAQNFPTQESGGVGALAGMGGMAGIDEDDDVPGVCVCVCVRACVLT